MKREIEKLGKYKYYIRPAYKQWVQQTDLPLE